MDFPKVDIVVTEAPNVPTSKLDTSEQAKKMVEQSGAKGCVTVSHNPSVQVYFALKKKIEQSEDDWLDEFLRLDGLNSLLESLCHMTGKAFTNFSDAILMLDCVSCIRSILNRQIGLEFILQKQNEQNLMRKLVTVLDSGNTLSKKQVFEVLAVVSVYGNRGYQLVIDALQDFKKQTNQSHMFSVIVNELKDADTVPFKTAILTLINCLLMANSDLVERCRLRTELEGLQLLDVLSFLRKEDSDEDLSIQLEKFHVNKHRDEEDLERQTRINMTDPHQLIKEITKKIFATPKESSLVQILQDLLFLSQTPSEDEEESEALWDILKTMVHHLATDKKRQRFVVNVKGGEIIPLSSGQENVCDCTKVEGDNSSNKPVKTHQNTVARARKLFEVQPDITNSPALVIKNRGRLDRFKTPTRPPITQLKPFRWVPLFEEDMLESDACTIWDREDARTFVLPYCSDLESMFSENSYRQMDITEIQLLESSSRLQVNLYLERLEIGVDDLVSSLNKEDPLPVNLTGLRYLSQVLPPQSEVTALRKYRGSRDSLGLAEQFLLYLSDIKQYRLLLEGHLTRAEFTSGLSKLKSSLKAQTDACQEILNNVPLAKFFHLILDVGNFLNYDKYNGNAAGFKLTTLCRLNQVRSNIPNKSLLHVVVKLAEDKDTSMLQFLSDLSHLDKASRLSLEEIKSEVNEMNTRLRKLIQQLSKSSQHVRSVFEFFLEDVRQDFSNFQTEINSLRLLSHKVAVYFCEEELDFSLQDCFKDLLCFCRAVRKCKEENTLFGKQQKLAIGRMSQLKSHVKNRRVSLEFGKEAVASSSFVEDRGQVLENLLTEIHRGNYQPLLPSDATTPDRDDQTFFMDLNCLSPIQQVFSPSIQRQPLPPIASVETLNDDTLVNEDPNNSVYDILGEYQEPFDATLPGLKPLENSYCQPLSIKTSVEVHHTATRPSTLPPLKQSELLAGKLDIAPKFDPTADKVNCPPKKTHHRSRSDLLEVSTITEKWVMYENGQEFREKCVDGDVNKAKNRLSALYSMDLEDKGSLKTDDKIHLPTGPVMVRPGQEPFKRNKNRSSLRNFLSKISGSRHKGTTVGGKDKAGKRKEEPPIGVYTRSDKENVPAGSKLFASQRSKKDNILKMRNK